MKAILLHECRPSSKTFWITLSTWCHLNNITRVEPTEYPHPTNTAWITEPNTLWINAPVWPTHLPPQQQQYQVGQDGRLMSLREQQVIRLQREIAHQAGVRLTLRKKDCMNSIAFVNVFNHVSIPTFVRSLTNSPLVSSPLAMGISLAHSAGYETGIPVTQIYLLLSPLTGVRGGMEAKRTPVPP